MSGDVFCYTMHMECGDIPIDFGENWRESVLLLFFFYYGGNTAIRSMTVHTLPCKRSHPGKKETAESGNLCGRGIQQKQNPAPPLNPLPPQHPPPLTPNPTNPAPFSFPSSNSHTAVCCSAPKGSHFPQPVPLPSPFPASIPLLGLRFLLIPPGNFFIQNLFGLQKVVHFFFKTILKSIFPHFPPCVQDVSLLTPREVVKVGVGCCQGVPSDRSCRYTTLPFFPSGLK